MCYLQNEEQWEGVEVVSKGEHAFSMAIPMVAKQLNTYARMQMTNINLNHYNIR